MTFAQALKEVRDPYERKARMTPGLLVILPLLIPILWTFGARNPLLTASLGLVTSCGVIYGLASIARGRGKLLEERLIRKWGGMPSTIVLRHRDDFLDRVTKARYHEEIAKKLGIRMPSEVEEAEDPVTADASYIAAARALRERTRGKPYGLLLKENIAYGFHRNMCAMRLYGVVASLIGMVAGVVLSKTVQLHPFFLDLDRITPAGGVTCAVSLAMLVAWLYFSPDAVRRIGYVYAERLFEALKSLRASRAAAETGQA
ncbi:hypothetical protein [Rubrivivax gelatinosus]|uniref:MotA/TolQ/ExbB proton channel domain-containing protein n=1 Tax=Rubrivivax gelatinosus TaxID=28068 RepID=A0ABS1DXV7_RUBGE|nr:hypothetical protein [Rubrivivax gelatinosus]MBK1714922.1 hypothetical protein [Rubrivivax gelatinosus]